MKVITLQMNFVLKTKNKKKIYLALNLLSYSLKLKGHSHCKEFLNPTFSSTELNLKGWKTL